MGKISFLKILKEENKLKLTNPNDNISNSYNEKAKKSLISSKTLFKINNLEDSIALSYYAMYHSLLSLLFKVGIKSENHSASIILLKCLFKISNKNILKAKKDRENNQYFVDFQTTKQETKRSIQITEEFIINIQDFISKISIKDIESYQKYFQQITNTFK